MSIFDKFKKSKIERAQSVVSKKETAKVKIDRPEPNISKTEVDDQPKVNQSFSAKDSKFHGLLVRPLITEKATNLGQKNQYVFAISNKANKIQIAQAIEARYGVKPIKVNVLNISGKVVRRGRQIGRTKDWRKAVITLPAGKNIQIHEGV